MVALFDFRYGLLNPGEITTWPVSSLSLDIFSSQRMDSSTWLLKRLWHFAMSCAMEKNRSELPQVILSDFSAWFGMQFLVLQWFSALPMPRATYTSSSQSWSTRIIDLTIINYSWRQLRFSWNAVVGAGRPFGSDRRSCRGQQKKNKPCRSKTLLVGWLALPLREQ